MNSVKTLVLAIAVTLAGSAAFAAQGVYGNWTFPQFSNGPLVINSYLTVATGTVTAHSTCLFDGKSAVVEISAPATITASQISILGAAQKDVTINGVNCHASVQPSTMDYVVSPDDANLTLSIPGQGSFTLPRQ